MRGQRRLPGWSSMSSVTRGRTRLDGASTISFSAYLPSLWRWVERMPRRGSGSGPSTAAPARGEVDAGRVDLRPHHQHVARPPGTDPLVGHGEHVDEARALVAHVHDR